ncbi:hypothetical protein FRB90_006819, partial [Tulasnella sp. 427]
IPGAISRAADVLRSKGYPPYVTSNGDSIIRREDFDYSARAFEYDFFGQVGDTIEIFFDSKIYSQGVNVEGGGDGIEVSTSGEKVVIKVEKEREIAFIKQEAHEKAREIKVKADEEFAIEKVRDSFREWMTGSDGVCVLVAYQARIVRQETNAIDAAFEKKKKQAETSQKIAQSTLTNKSRLRLLQAREQHLQDLFSEARAGLLKLPEDQGRYTQVLESSILEGLLRFMEPTVTVKCRAKDKGLTEKAAEGAKQQYTEISGLKVSVTVDGSLADDSAGGVKLAAGNDRITMDNTLDERLKLLEDRMLPEIRYDLFAAMAPIKVISPEITHASLHKYRPFWLHVYAAPFLSLYPVLAYAYFVKYDEWIQSEEWTFLFVVGLGLTHALSFLVTRWSTGAKAFVTTSAASSLVDADCVRIVPAQHRGQGEIVPLTRKQSTSNLVPEYSFSYQRDTYVLSSKDPIAFERLPYPSDSRPPLGDYKASKGISSKDVPLLTALFGKNEFDIPIPSFAVLFGEHATAPFFVFQIFCVGLWVLDEYWYYSLFTLFMLIVFECTVVWQRLRTLQEFRTMSIAPYPIQCLRDNKWQTVQTDHLLPGDVVSITRTQTETAIPGDLLLLSGTCIVNEAMLSGESTPLLKEAIDLRENGEKLDMDVNHKNNTLFGGTKALQAGGGVSTPDGGCLAVVLRTGFGTSQGQLVRTMIFSTER